MLGQEQNKSASQVEVKQRHPFTVSNEAAVTPGRTAKPQNIIRSDAVKQLNKEGYYVYNTPEKQDVYITIQPSTAFFDDEEPRMVRMAGGSFVSGGKRAEAFTMPARSEPEPVPMDYTQPADIFTNAKPRESFEEIDFNTVIIKKNESFEKEIEEKPKLFSPPSYREVIVDPVMIEQPIMKKEPVPVCTSSGTAAPAPAPKEIFIGFSEVPEYELEEEAAAEEKTTVIEESAVKEEIPVTAEGPTVEEPPVTEVPRGLHVEGNRPIDVAEMDVGANVELSSFVEKSVIAEMAATSESMPMVIPVAEQMPAVPEITEEAAETIEDVPEMNAAEESETVAGPAIVEIADETEMVKITVPCLYRCDELISELSCESVRTIPEDGLESYDCVFRNAPVSVTSSAPMPEIKEPAPGTRPFKFTFK